MIVHKINPTYQPSDPISCKIKLDLEIKALMKDCPETPMRTDLLEFL